MQPTEPKPPLLSRIGIHTSTCAQTMGVTHTTFCNHCGKEWAR